MLAWIGIVAGLMIPGMITYTPWIYELWIAIFWFVPAAFSILAVEAAETGKVPEGEQKWSEQDWKLFKKLERKRRQ